MVQKIWRLLKIFIRQFFGGTVSNKVQQQRSQEFGLEVLSQRSQAAREVRVMQFMGCAKHAVTLKYYMAGYETWPDGRIKTFCNVFARKFLTGSLGLDLYDNTKLPGYNWLNYDLSSVAPEGLNVLYYNTSIPRMMSLCIRAANAGEIVELNELEAKEYAVQGEVIFGICALAGWNHEFLVYPGDLMKEMRIVQQGLYPLFDKPISHPYCFGKDWRTKLEGRVRFFLFPFKREV